MLVMVNSVLAIIIRNCLFLRFPMGRVSYLKSVAVNVANESTCRDRHGAAVVRGNRLMTVGCNNNLRTSFLGRLDICQHAEMDAVTCYINRFLRRTPEHKKLRKIRSLTVWSVRLTNRGLTFACPCQICLYRLKTMGFKRVAFSNDSGDVEFCRISNLQNSHLSSAQRRFHNLIRW